MDGYPKKMCTDLMNCVQIYDIISKIKENLLSTWIKHDFFYIRLYKNRNGNLL